MEKVTRVDCKQISNVKRIYWKAKFNGVLRGSKAKNKERLIYLHFKKQLSNAVSKVCATSLQEAKINKVRIC